MDRKSISRSAGGPGGQIGSSGGDWPEATVEQDQNQEESYEGEPDSEYRYSHFQEDASQAAIRAPGLGFRFVHCIGMMVVAGIILAIVFSVNGGFQTGKGGNIVTISAPAARTTARDREPVSRQNTEEDAANAARATQYIASVTQARQDADSALAQLQLIMNEYLAVPEIRKDAAWRDRISGSLLTAKRAAMHLQGLSSPPAELTGLNRSLYSEGDELGLSVQKFAQTLDSGDQSYLTVAMDHANRCRQLADQAAHDFADYQKGAGH